jgi:hypothetical protein
MPKLSEIETLYNKISELTRPKCATCNVPYGCCAKEHCDFAAMMLREKGIEPPAATGHKLPFMGPSGCILPPHHRPICAVHVCDKQVYSSTKFCNKYMKLREQISELEAEEYVKEKKCL